MGFPPPPPKTNRMGKHILLFPLGSSGDVHPFIGLGRKLLARGHRVTLFTCEHFETAAAKSGLEFVSTYSTEDYFKIQDDPEIWHPTRGPKAIMAKTQSVESYRDCLRLIAERNVPGETVVVGGTLALGPRTVRDHLKVPLVTVHLQPGVVISVDRPARYAGGNFPAWAPRWLRRAGFYFAEKWIIDPMVAPTVNAFRAELGLPPVKKIMTKYWHSPDAVVGLFPAWYAAPAGDWPAHMRLTSFPLYDEANVRPPTPEHQAFFDAGSPPVVVTFGSAMRHAKPHFAAAAEAIHKIGRRGILLTPYREQVPDPLPPGVIHADYIPLSQILSKAAVMVHHGGIGTAAQTLAAGIPHLVMPMTHDQPDNADRLEKLGVARWLLPAKFTAANVARELETLLADPRFKTAATQYAETLKGEDGLGAAADVIEKTGMRDEG